MSARDFLIHQSNIIFRERETRPIADWARENIVLDPSENRSMAGTPYDIQNTPYNRVVFDFIQSRADRELVIMKSSQIGLTLSVYIAIAWLAKHNPGNLFYVARDESAVRELGKQRLTPILEQVSKDFADELGEMTQTIMVKRVNGATLRLVGAQSAAGFVSWPVSYGFIDEAETHPDLPEGSTIALTKARFKGDSEYKLITFSKAQDEPQYEVEKDTKVTKLVSGQGTRMADEYYSGTQEKYHVPCPHCGHFQELVWGQMKVDDSAAISPKGVLPVEYDHQKVLEGTYYECESCHGRILDKHKRRMVPQGKWVPTPNGQRVGPYKHAHPGRRSVHISDLYVFLFETVSWPKLMLKWIEAQGDYQKLAAFYNDFLGLPRPEQKSAGRVEMAFLDRLVSDYPRLGLYDRGRRWVGEKPRLTINPLFIGIAVDKQDGYLKFVISAFMRDGEMYVLDWGVLAYEDDLTFLLESFRVISADGTEYGLLCGLMDCGHMRASVIEYCFDIRGLLVAFGPARGHGAVHARGSWWPSQDISLPGRSVEIVNFSSQFWENELYRHRIIEGDRRKPSKRYPRIHFPKDVDDDFKREVANVHQVEKKEPGRNRLRLMWEKMRQGQPNDYGDCLKMLLLVWAVNGPDPEEEGSEEEG